jgi:hypothetical protein
MELSTSKILEEYLVQSTFHQTPGNEFTFHQDNNLKHKAKSTLRLLIKKAVNTPEWPSYSFDLNLPLKDPPPFSIQFSPEMTRKSNCL